MSKDDVKSLSSLVQAARHRGFVGLALDGADPKTAIASERDGPLLECAIDIAQQWDEKIWMECLARRLAETAGNADQRLRSAAIMAAYGKCEDAQRAIAGLDVDPNDEVYRSIRGVLHAKAGRAEQALAVFDALPGRVAKAHPAPIVLSTLYEMLEQCTIAHIESLLQALAVEFPQHLLIRSFNLRFQLLVGNSMKSATLVDLPDDVRAKSPEYDRRSFIEAVADYLEFNGWANQLFEFVRDSLASDPTHWALYDRAARSALSAHRSREFSAIVAALPDPDSAEALAVLCRWHIDENRLDAASALLDRLRIQSADLFLKARLYFSLFSRSQEQIDAAFNACLRCGIPMLGATVSYAIHTYYYNCSPQRLRDCLTRLEPLATPVQKHAHFWQTYLRCLIAVGEGGAASRCYFSLPSGLANSAPLKPFDLYFDAKANRHESVRKEWIKYIQNTRHPCVNAQSSYPRTIRLRYSEKPSDILVFVTLYNAIDYLDAFLDHYRRLGVDHFFVTDNGSDDGSLERLCEQDDVSVFQNRDSFAKSAFGVLWVNHLLQRFGTGHWCFHVDVDEFFVFPDCGGSRALRDLLSYCERFGFASVRAIELDMYPELLEGEPGTDPFAASRYFDVDYVTVEAELPPYVMIQGGIRGRLTGLPLSMQKSPLILMSRDVRYFECNHSTTHCPVADVSGAVLHYKFVGNMKRRIASAVARGEHFAGAITYRRLHSAVSGMDQARSLLSDHSRLYRTPSDLEFHGLIKSSPEWTAYSAQHLPGNSAVGALVD